MPSNPSPFEPSKFSYISIGPLTRGMILDQPSNRIPVGSLLTAKNYSVGTEGPKRRSVLDTYAGGDSVNYPPIRGIIPLWADSGISTPIVIDSKFVYRVELSGFTGQYWTLSSNTIDTSGTAVVSTGTNFVSNDITAGDVLVVVSGTDYVESATIAEVDETNLSALTLDAALTADVTGSNYEIRRAFNSEDGHLVDYARAQNRIIFADGQRKLTAYNPSTGYSSYCSSGVDPVADTVMYHQDRLWCGRTHEGNYDYRYRIRWTSVTDITSFDTAYSLDLPYVPGALVKLMPLGELIIAYYADSVWVGRPTQRAGSSLPYYFFKLETARTGLVGVKAVCEYLDGHFFIGEDDVYYLGASLGIERLGSPVVKEMLVDTDYLWAAFAVPDPKNSRILFGVPEGGATITKIWSFDYKSRAWSYFDINSGMIALEEIFEVYTWDSVSTGVSWDSGLIGTSTPWNEIAGSTEGNRLWVGQSSFLRYFLDTATQDFGTNAVTAELETGDLDFGSPDVEKLCTRLSLKIDRYLTDDLSFTVTGSTDRGNTWKTLGTLLITAGDDEKAIGFKLKGSTLRFKFVSDSTTQPYIVNDVVLKVRGVGGEIHYGPED